MDAIRKSDAFNRITEEAIESESLLGGKEEALSYAEYLKEPREVWARAYYQFIADQSRHAGLRNWRELQRYGRTAELMSSHWTTEDFKPIQEAILRVLNTLGWIK